MANKHKVVFTPGTYSAKTLVPKPGLDLEAALIDFMLAYGLATNPSGDCCTLVSVGGGGGVSNLSSSRTGTGYTIANTNGTGFTLQLATGTLAGLQSPADFTKVGFLTVTAATNLDDIRTTRRNRL